VISCRYVGGESSSIGDREFDTIGQRANFSENIFRQVAAGNAAFIPESEFLRVGFTPDELSEYGPIGDRVDPPQSFCEKLSRAQQIFRDIQSRMLEDKQAFRILAEIGN
jgi:hypothetical protein